MPNPIASIRDYLKSSIAELKKVTWPSRDMTIRYAALVIAVSAALAVFFAALDFGFSRAVTTALERKSSAPPTAAPEAVKPDLEPTPAASATPAAKPPETQPTPPVEGGFQLPPLENKQ